VDAIKPLKSPEGKKFKAGAGRANEFKKKKNKQVSLQKF